MASPQCEDGFTRIADELLEAVIAGDFDRRELKLIFAVIRRTYGYGKKADVIAASQFADMTGIDARDVRRTLAKLKDRGVITSTPTAAGSVIGIVKDYDQWQGKAETKGRGKTPRGKTPRGKTPQGQNTPGVKHPAKGGVNHPSPPGVNHPTTIDSVDRKTPPPQERLNDSRGGGGGDRLFFPHGLDQRQQAQAARLVAGCNGVAQDLLDELAGLMAAGAIRVSPLACLRGLVRKEQAGAFTLEAGAKVRRAREQAKRSAARSEAAHQEDTDEVLRQHAKMLGISEEEYLRQMGRKQ